MPKVAIIENIHQDGINLLKENPDFEFEIIDDTSEENLIKVLPKFDACTLRVSKLNEKINLLNRCKALIIPSLWEGFGLTALEALAYGTPIIASNQGAIKEIIGDKGLYFNPYDTLLET